MGMDAPSPPPPPPVKPPAPLKIDQAAAARSRSDLDRRRVSRNSLRIEPGLATGEEARASGTGLRLY